MSTNMSTNVDIKTVLETVPVLNPNFVNIVLKKGQPPMSTFTRTRLLFRRVAYFLCAARFGPPWLSVRSSNLDPQGLHLEASYPAYTCLNSRAGRTLALDKLFDPRKSIPKDCTSKPHIPAYIRPYVYIVVPAGPWPSTSSSILDSQFLCKDCTSQPVFPVHTSISI